MLTAASARSSGIAPVKTRLPNMSGWKRAPSSLVKKATASGRLVTTPASSSVCDDLEPGEDAERAVVVSAGRHGVDVAAHHHRRAVFLAAPHADDIADRVDRHRQPELAHPLDDEVAARLVGVAEREAAYPAVGPRAFLGQPLQARQQPRAVDPKILTHLMAPTAGSSQRASYTERFGDLSCLIA